MILVSLLLVLSAAAGQADELPWKDVEHAQIPFESGRWEESEHEIEELIRDNLDVDLSLWANKGLSVKDVYSLYRQISGVYPALPPPRVSLHPFVIQLLLIYNNTLYQVQPDGKPYIAWNQIDNIGSRTLDALYIAINDHNMTLPNALFVFNSDDNAARICAPRRMCPAPLFSVIKGGDPHGSMEDLDTDIVIPQMHTYPRAMHTLPWEHKFDRALFRGRGFCGPNLLGVCHRLWLAHISQLHNFADMLDVGLVEGYQQGKSGGRHRHIPDLPKAEPIAIGEHARWRYLLSLDGISASSRLNVLMTSDSVVLKADSTFLEHYHRSIKPGIHYRRILWNSTYDVLDLLETLRLQEFEGGDMHTEMIQASTTFARKYLHLRPRLLFWRAALVRYKALFPDMEAHVKELYEKIKDEPGARFVPQKPDFHQLHHTSWHATKR